MSVDTFEPREITEGQSLPTITRAPLTITDFVRYQGASGDMNPIHHDGEFARAAGFEQPFAVGMLPAGVMSTYVTDQFGPSAVREFGVRFREQAWPGDELSYSGRVVRISLAGGERVAELELLCHREVAGAGTPPAGGVHLDGTARVVVPSRLSRP